MALMVNFGAWGKLVHEKNPEVENLVALSLEDYLRMCVISPLLNLMISRSFVYYLLASLLMKFSLLFLLDDCPCATFF
jgi:hypothetical protein